MGGGGVRREKGRLPDLWGGGGGRGGGWGGLGGRTGEAGGEILSLRLYPKGGVGCREGGGCRGVEPELEAFCRDSGLANFKRPRRYIFVTEIPKSPVGKLLRRKLVAGEYETVSPLKGTAA